MCQQQHKTHYNFYNWMKKCDSIWKHWFSVPFGDLWNSVFNKFAIWLHFSFVNRSWFRITVQHMTWLIRLCFFKLFSVYIYFSLSNQYYFVRNRTKENKHKLYRIFCLKTLSPHRNKNNINLVDLLLSFTVSLLLGMPRLQGFIHLK